MDMVWLSNVLLKIFYVLIGLMMIITTVYTLKDKSHKSRFGTAAFWAILSVIFMFGDYIPARVVGGLIVIIAILSMFNQVNMGTIKQLDSVFAQAKADKLGVRIFIPSLLIAFVALFIAQFTKISGTAAIGISAVVALISTFIIVKPKSSEAIIDSDRMLQAVGATAILPQFLAALGSLFAAAGVGKIISNMISSVIPQGNIWLGITAYCLGMAIFTIIMGNAFAAFTVITLGVGAPLVFAQGGNPIVASALAMTAGFCGTLLTPMAANFNILPAALLEMDDGNGVIKAQAFYAIGLLILHIPLMYFLAF